MMSPLFSILLMAVATLGIAAASTYASIGIGAPIVLLLLRILQGVALGGELPGSYGGHGRSQPNRRAGQGR
jgi:MFS family permease